MKKNNFLLLLLLALGGCFAYSHRRVIKAKLNNEPMPKAPSWHFWVSPENRKTAEKEI